MSSYYLFFALILAISQLSSAFFPYGGYGYGAVPGFPFAHAHFGAAPLLRPIAFSNGPIYTSIIPSIHPIYHTPRFEIRNIIRTANKDTAHFSGTTHRSSGFPFNKRV